ncbi:xylose isomerase [Halolactibacillus miurensis]|uniref:Sugar phosphate isomerase/epimerase n=1 Tax=Halolactibacillus miurensis TaxID=306541 RepID=A0A1I6P796_9BACI|nr:MULTISPECIES: TIM barrel protein [Halolactibacillus]GEM03074.1 xylose isomerase [Halolactibacillus miurensis]SFS36059.1 Sugar phosphate isomerase/epimerase [Halolactibacillus miurensis]
MELGLCSITFRQHTPKDIIVLAKDQQLQAIEWGGDIHVPPGNLTRAKEIGDLTRAHGLRVSSYGSYYHAGTEEDFDAVLETALALETSHIRIWAGRMDKSKTPKTYSEETFQHIVQDIIRCAIEAKKHAITLHLEYHAFTYTDSGQAALKLIQAVNQPNVKLYWQPLGSFTKEQQVLDLNMLQSYISHIHVFQWDETFNRYPLDTGESTWLDYIRVLEQSQSHLYLMEFVKNDNINQFNQDVQTLHHWKKTINASLRGE